MLFTISDPSTANSFTAHKFFKELDYSLYLALIETSSFLKANAFLQSSETVTPLSLMLSSLQGQDVVGISPFSHLSFEVNDIICTPSYIYIYIFSTQFY